MSELESFFLWGIFHQNSCFESCGKKRKIAHNEVQELHSMTSLYLALVIVIFAFFSGTSRTMTLGSVIDDNEWKKVCEDRENSSRSSKHHPLLERLKLGFYESHSLFFKLT